MVNLAKKYLRINFALLNRVAQEKLFGWTDFPLDFYPIILKGWEMEKGSHDLNFLFQRYLTGKALLHRYVYYRHGEVMKEILMAEQQRHCLLGEKIKLENYQAFIACYGFYIFLLLGIVLALGDTISRQTIQWLYEGFLKDDITRNAFYQEYQKTCVMQGGDIAEATSAIAAALDTEAIVPGREDVLSIITCVNDEERYIRMKNSVLHLDLPEGMTCEFVPVYNALSMCEGYNEGMIRAQGHYKVYVHQDVLMQQRNMLLICLEKLRADDSIGMIGLAGAEVLPDTGIWWESEKAYIALQQGYDTQARGCGDIAADGAYVEALDGFFLLTAVDIYWREDVFSGWHFYDAAQCQEFLQQGKKLWIPNQGRGYCAHDSQNEEIDALYHYWRQVFLHTYGIGEV